MINHEIDPSSIEVSRRARRAKTDRIDLEKMMRAFLAYLRGEPRACSVVHVPSVEDEDRKRRNRERDRLKKERTAHTNRIEGAAAWRKAFAMPMPTRRVASSPVSTACAPVTDGRCRRKLKQEIVREHARLMSGGPADRRTLEATSMAEVKRCGARLGRGQDQAAHRAEGPWRRSARRSFVNEVFYRSFANRRQVGACFGLDRHPLSTVATASREQGISKAGNRRARTLADRARLAMAPTSTRQRAQPLVPCTRVGDQKGRVRRIAAVALARKLMVALWRYLTTGVVPTGATLRPAH